MRTKRNSPTVQTMEEGGESMEIVYTPYGCKIGNAPIEYATDGEALEASKDLQEVEEVSRKQSTG